MTQLKDWEFMKTKLKIKKNINEVFPDASAGDCDVFAVFDFDETIAITDSLIHVIDIETKERLRSYTPDQYAVQFGSGESSLAANEAFDYSEFDDVPDATKTTEIFEILKSVVRCGVTSAAILTARGSEAQKPIKDFLAKLGVRLQVVHGVDSPLGSAKAQKFRGYARQFNPSTMHFYEDSDSNRAAVENMVRNSKEFEGVDVYLHNVKKGMKQSSGHVHVTYETPAEPDNPMVQEAREKTADLIVEALTDTDIRRIEAVARREIRDFLRQNLEKKVTDFIQKELKGKENEKIIKNIASKMIVDLYRSLWTKRSFWESDIK